ncbi:2-hydroxyacid dehydrogenase [Acuticoccus mangrovi]|uniref:Glyoxylate/hydroxypyruvate reductase A n=1 Tax=Acuticoccus mangrovi TaxID=2796142 RepID=A0A934IM15_9HYPH|nr:glyoxylate/hydroxypyruvate reductase A [Acuticoccus mangrovi]MBJ3777406.1 glyoxylate/hydroxypyruvate reductase A [Acuticoccus mangrovi]
MASLLTVGSWRADAWVKAFHTAAPGRTFYLYGRDEYDPAEIRYAITWRPPAGLLPSLPNLQAIFNLGAGVDGVLADPDLPDLPVVRLVDDTLTGPMGEWVALQVLTHHRRALTYLAQQGRQEWEEHDQPVASQVRVGIMGYGILGSHCAKVLTTLGYTVSGWSRSPKPADVPLHVGAEGLPEFLANTDYLVVLLPLTPQTRDIIDAELIGQLAQDGVMGGPVLINAGRGGLQNEDDLLAALHSGTLAGASLDVFQTEPLPADHPLWTAPNLVITPHAAAPSNPTAVSRYITGQISAFEAGKPLQNVVERGRGY